CASAAPFVALMDADHQHDPDLLPRMLECLKADETDLCIGSRFARGASTAGWDAPERERLSGFANAVARRMTRVDLTDPMSGYFMLPSATARALAPRLSGIGFKILLDLLCASPQPLRVREFPLDFGPRREGISKLDRATAFDFLVGLYDRLLGRIVPTRFALFATVGALGAIVHFAVLIALFPQALPAFWQAQAIAVLTAMSFNFWLDNWLTYRDRQLTGAGRLLGGWAKFCATCAVGGFANVAAASLLEGRGLHWALAAAAGIAIGSVWNFALSSRYVWGRY
ncbi:MAG: GtrA family protein, partial [Erythrobacter sp.]